MKFEPAWWLRSRHLQTIWPALFRRVKPLPVKRKRMATADGDFVDVDWCGAEHRPIVMLLHGLTGSSNSAYIQGMQVALSQIGMRSAALNFRGCSGEPNSKARVYHSGDTEDLDGLYRKIRKAEPDTPLAAVGYSLGGNVLLKWLGERRGQLDLFAAAAVSVPLLLNICADQMDVGFSKIYRDRMIRALKASLYTKLAMLQSSGAVAEAKKITDIGELTAIRSFWEFDDRVIAPLHYFKDVHDYYCKSSSRQFLRNIEIPTLLVQAKDDPFMNKGVLPGPEELSPSIQLELSDYGGHVGFITGSVPLLANYWLEQRIPEFFREHIQAVRSANL